MHGTDTPGATDENESTYFHNGYRASSATVFIDWDSITQLIPDNEQSWGAGPTANSMYLNCELCQPATHNPAQFTEVWKRGVWYAALKFYKNGWKTGPGLWSHDGMSKKYGETNHADPIAYFAEYGKSFSDFVNEVDAMILAMVNEEKGGIKVADTARSAVSIAPGVATIAPDDVYLVVRCPKDKAPQAIADIKTKLGFACQILPLC